MIKKITKDQLKLGMFIHDLNCGWMDHAFLRSRFMLRKESDLEKILASGIQEVYIDTIKGIDAQGPSLAEVDQEISGRLMDSVTHPLPVPTTRTTHQEELTFAKEVQKEASKVIHSVLTDVRLGKQIQVEQVSPVVGRITESILRNPGTLVSLCRLREGDTYTFQHSVSVCTLLVSFCRYMELSPEVIHQAGMGGMLHDVGKMRVPDHILNKPGKLTEAEFEIMKKHVDLGLETLEQTPGISQTVLQVAGEHHERFEGTGYPKRLKGSDISLLGRMAAIVDVYDALTSNRVYHRGMEPPEALKKLFEWSSHHFDEELVQHFIQAIGIYPVGTLVRLESERLAVVIEQGEQGLLHPKVRVIFDIRRNARIGPLDLDLASNQAGEDAIAGNEEPGAWNLNPFDYLSLEI